MPPWAAIECARRGVSWKQKHLTRNPSSPRLAAAAAPAKPDPTTSTVNFRLLLGLTSRRWLRWSSQAEVRWPMGALASSFIADRSLQADQPAQHGQREGDVAEGDDPGEGMGEAVAPVVEARMVEAQRLEHAPQAMVEVETEPHLPFHLERASPPHLTPPTHL